ncbi:hypothetical protein Poly30_42810 [Planctomycetes bacterium Poly30]|uniref:Peptidase S8/S53 domain-containing protein n=1 Tax=Saltatorellus ferox TaxID=2528018 RepID=A0A518EXB8_9BACT|nr:hypothetical protein Poly30_42810 [Planctomycetes bacterium Poly30]
MNGSLLSFSLAVLAPVSLPGASAFAQAATPATAATAESSQIRLRYASFDPLGEVPAVSQALRAKAGQNLVIVQLGSTPTQSDRDAIAAAGGELIGYLPDNAYLVRVQPEGASVLRGNTAVRWVGEYHPAYRLQPELLDEQAFVDPQPVRYNIVVANKRTDKPGLMARVEAVGGRVDSEQVGSLLLEVTLTGPQLLQVAAMDEVLWIDRWTAPEEDMDNARIQGGGNYVETQAGYTGAGVNAHVYEGVEASHPDFTGGVVNVRSGGEAQSHGHCTAGIVFGNGSSNPAVRGMAPDAGKFFTNYSSVSTSRYQVVSDLVNIHNVSHTTASWGGGRTFFYTATSAESDDIVFDHDLAWTQSQSNAGNQDSRPEAWAKNVFSIGAVQHFNNSNPNDDSWSAGNGSTGPASDGRIKPTLCAYYDATGTSDRTGSSGYSSGSWYANFGGTSGATPIVAGHNVLAIQMFTDEVAPGIGPFGNVLRVPGGTAHQNRPHFTTLKALQVVSANQYAFTATSSNNRRQHQGWGFPSLQNMWDNRTKTILVDETDVLTQGQSSFYTANVGINEPALKVCLNWNEPAGNPAASAQLINNLSLRVTSPDGTQSYWGNSNLESGVWSTTGGSEDTVNSLECVFVQNPAPGMWSIEVMATSVVEDNHVETPAVDADFGLAIVGGLSGFVSQICSGVINSTGVPAVLVMDGSPVLADMDLTLSVENLPFNSLGYFVTSKDIGIVANPGGSTGNLCIASPSMGRYAANIQNSGSTGSVTLSIDLTAIPIPTGTEPAMIGDTRCFQYWYRDSIITIPTSNFSSAACLIFE